MNSQLLGDQRYHVHHGDVIPHMAELPAACMDCAIYSPPFPAVYAYTSLNEDIGNCEQPADFKLHFSFFFRQILRVLKPGRVMVVHCTQIPRMKRSGGVGLCDFRGILIRLAERAGFIFDYDWTIRKNPQAQAITTRSRSLQFAGLESDRAQSRGAIPDYLLKFLVPGENAVAVDSDGDVSRNNWIDFAENQWEAEKYPIDSAGTKAYTLNAEEARGPEDTRHICPLQLSIIDRLVRLYTNPDEIVFSPFTGMGSEGYVSVRLGRRFYGCEIKDEYHATALRMIERGLKSNETKQALFASLA